ncbi:MAG: ThuA domain-containing protein [Verrucomicrobiota bacterium JB023]|nr:ThuA domain-containing protein [Verrucomicrobiota bacterium JB023]
MGKIQHPIRQTPASSQEAFRIRQIAGRFPQCCGTPLMAGLLISLLSLLSSPRGLGHGFEVLVFTKTAGYQHGSIPAGVTALEELGAVHDFGVRQTDDAATFISLLDSYQVAVFLNTSGDVFTSTQESAFQAWYRSGRGYVGIHAAADTEHDWPWYEELVGAEFANHPAIQTGTVKFLDQVHPITNTGSPRALEWTVSEEWYNFTESPRGKAHVLAVLDELVTTNSDFNEAPDTGITGGQHGNDHPIIWCQEFDGGRSAYLGPGHNSATFADPIFRDLMLNSIEWAAGELGGDSGATLEENWEKVTLETNLNNPMSLDIDSNGLIYLIERFGAIKTHNEVTGATTLIGTLDEYSGGEYGGLGIALAPDFDTSRQLYILWSPNISEKTRISRFTLDESGLIDPTSEVIIIDYLTNRVLSGHHQGGCLRFDADGNLLAAIGDNTQASGYSPRNDSQIGRDARKSSPNTNDLRGKIIRITPDVGGGPPAHPNYTIPSGNLFPPGTPLAREEIYVMGARNPFRFCIDPKTGWLYYGDVGPDATYSGSGAYEGAGGHDEFNQVKEAGFFGWPYYIANNKAYLDGNAQEWTDATLRTDLANYFTLPSFTGSGAVAGDPALLPDPQPAWIWYPDTESAPAFSEVGSSSQRCAMAGAVYEYTPGNNFPSYYDGSVFLMLWSRNQILEVKNRPDGSILEITRFAPHLSFSRPHEMTFGPNGAMYVIEWGNADLVKIQYTEASATPITVATADTTSGDLPLTVQFSSDGTYDPDSTDLTYAWDFDGDQVIDSTEPNPLHVYNEAGNFTAQLTVTDEEGLFSSASLGISAGNHAPVVTFETPGNFSFFDWGDYLNFAIQVVDVEDGSSAAGDILESEVLFEASLGHADHQHNEVQANLLEGQLHIPRDESHPFDLDLSYVLEAYYSDEGAPGVNPVQSTARVDLQPKVTMAQTFDEASGVETSPTLDPVGGDVDVTSIDEGDYLMFSGLNLDGISAIRLRASAAGAGGSVAIRQGSLTGQLVGTVTVNSTGNESIFQDFETALESPLPGSHDLYFIFNGAGESTDLMRLNWINFRGQGATVQPERPSVVHLATPVADTLRLTFDQAMDWSTLANPNNYVIDNSGLILAATPTPDQRAVDLLLGEVEVGSYYTITLEGLEDLAGDALAPQTAVTFLHRTADTSTFEIGLNAGGPDYVDSAGQLYLADTSTPALSTAPVTLLVDFRSSAGSSLASTATDFAQGDSSIQPTAPVNVIIGNPGDPEDLLATTLEGATLQNDDAGSYSTNKGSFDDVPILDGYLHTGRLEAPRTATLAGLDQLADGAPITLTLWGVGDTPDSDTRFTVIHDGQTIGTETSDYDTATAEDTASTRVQFVFPKSPNDNSITIEWEQGGTTTAGFNGFSLTCPQGVVGEGSGSYYNGGSSREYNPTVENTPDPTLYQSERWLDGDLLYTIPVDNGFYDVHLHFAENYFSSIGDRVFNVSIEDSAPIFSPSLDVVGRSGGKNKAYDFWQRRVEVSDNLLNIDFLQDIQNPKVSAIGVYRVVSTSTPLPVPSFAHHLENHPETRFNPLADLDGDGLNSLMEYALGGNEFQPDDDRQPVLASSEGEEFALRFSRPEGIEDIRYEVEASADLNLWTLLDAQLEASPTSEGQQVVHAVNLQTAALAAGLSSPDGLFFRLKVTLIDPPAEEN